VKQTNLYKINRKYLTGKKVFIVSLLVMAMTILAIWLFGLGQHRTLFENSILSTTILSIAFFLFLTIGLYNGVKLKDDLGKITDKINKNNMSDISGLDLPGGDIPDVDGDEIGGIIVGILAWILVSVVLIFLIWFFGAILWTLVLVFAAMLYWIFFRALRLAFKNSNKCKNDLLKSIYYSVAYTILYNFWIYGIIIASHYVIK